MGTKLVEDRAGVIEKRRFIADGKDADLLRVEPKREVAGVMFDQKPDESFVGAERGAVNAEGNFLGVIAVLVTKIEPARLREIDLVRGDGEFAANNAPDLDVDFW